MVIHTMYYCDCSGPYVDGHLPEYFEDERLAEQWWKYHEMKERTKPLFSFYRHWGVHLSGKHILNIKPV